MICLQNNTKERIENEKAKEAATATALPTPTPMLAAVANPQFSRLTTAQATPTALSITSSVNPNSITPASQRSQHSSRSQKSLNFETPTQSQMPSLPCAVSPASRFDSSIQDSVDSTAKPKRGQGRPHKVSVAPMYDDFPENGTAEEKKRWKLHKNAEEWWYKKLMSTEAEEYHEKEK